MSEDLFELDEAKGEPEEEAPVEGEDAGEETEEDAPDDEDKQDEEDEEQDEHKPVATAAKKPEESRPVNVVEQDPYDFDKCLITVAMALMPDDGSPEGRPVMLGVRNHQDEPLLATCRLSDLMPLPGPVLELLEQLKADLPVRSERTEKRRKAEEEKRKAAADKSKKKPAPVKAAAKKAEQPANVNLFEMFDQQEVTP